MQQMAVRSILRGGVVGAIGFVLAYVLFDLNLLWSLGTYSAIGSMTAMLSVSKATIANLRHGISLPVNRVTDNPSP